jgi:hypothetical protein
MCSEQLGKCPNYVNVRVLCPVSPGCSSTVVFLGMIDRLKIKTVEVLPVEGLGLLDSVELFPVDHLPSLAPKKICDCRMVRDESIQLTVIGSVDFHSQHACSPPLCTLQATVHKDLVGHWLMEELHCNMGLGRASIVCARRIGLCLTTSL